MNKDKVINNMQEEVLFDNAQEAWFWFMQANEAKIVGAKCLSGEAKTSRPCEPEDIMNIVHRLYKQRSLLMDHVRILAHYGKRLSAPDKNRYREKKAYTIWKDAFSKIEPILINKGIIKGVFAH